MDASQFITRIAQGLIRLYQILFTGRPRLCRFYPTCSDYALQALSAKGLSRGLIMMGRRLLKCHPWHPGGYDPIQI